MSVVGIVNRDRERLGVRVCSRVFAGRSLSSSNEWCWKRKRMRWGFDESDGKLGSLIDWCIETSSYTFVDRLQTSLEFPLDDLPPLLLDFRNGNLLYGFKRSRLGFIPLDRILGTSLVCLRLGFRFGGLDYGLDLGSTGFLLVGD